MRTSTRAQRIFGTVAGNWFSRAYLALCAGLLIWVWVDSTFVDHPDASLAGVVPVLVTAPTSMVFVLVPEGSVLGYYLVVSAAALLNAAVIELVVRALRGDSHHSSRPARTVDA